VCEPRHETKKILRRHTAHDVFGREPEQRGNVGAKQWAEASSVKDKISSIS